jgi:hypothetical protein
MLPGHRSSRLGIVLAVAITFAEHTPAQTPPRVPPRGLNLLAARLFVDPSSLSFSYEIGSRPPTDQSVLVSSGRASLNFSATISHPWLSVSPTSGTTPQRVSVKVNPAGLTEGTYTGTVMLNVAPQPQIQGRVRETVTLTPVLQRQELASPSVRVAVRLIVTARPQVPAPARLQVDPPSLTFNHEIDARPPADQTVRVSSDVPVSFSAITSDPWLSVSPPRGTTPQQLSVKVNPAGLAEGPHSGAVTLIPISQSRELVARPARFAVLVIVTRRQPSLPPPRLQVDPAFLSFNYEVDSRPPADQTVRVSSDGLPLRFTAVTAGSNWLSISPTSGTTPQQLSVKVNPAGLGEQTYTETITLTPIRDRREPVSPSVRVAVRVIVTRRPPVSAPVRLQVDPPSLSFNHELDSRPPADQTVRVSSDGVPVTFNAAASSNWLSINPASGTTPQQLSVTVNPAGLTEGRYSDTVTLTPIRQPRESASRPARVTVTLIVSRRQPPLSPARLRVDPPSLSFSYEIGTAGPAERAVQVRSDAEAVSFAATKASNWLSVNPPTGTTPRQLSVTVNAVGLAAGQYTDTVTVSPVIGRRALSSGSVPLTVTLVVSPPARPPTPTPTAARLLAEPVSLSFSSNVGSSQLVEQPVQVKSDGVSLNFTATTSSDRFSVRPTDGTTPQQLIVFSVNTAGLGKGTLSGTITLRSAGASNVAQVAVTVVITRTTDFWWVIGLAAVLGLLGVVAYQRQKMRNMLRSSIRTVAEADPPAVTIDSGGEDFVASEIRIEITSDPGERNLKSDDFLVREARDE